MSLLSYGPKLLLPSRTWIYWGKEHLPHTVYSKK